MGPLAFHTAGVADYKGSFFLGMPGRSPAACLGCAITRVPRVIEAREKEYLKLSGRPIQQHIGGLLLALRVIVTFNPKGHRRVSQALAKMRVPAVVIDNASTDHTVERAQSRPGSAIANPRTGFSAPSIRDSGHRCRIYPPLNPDAELFNPVDRSSMPTASALAAGNWWMRKDAHRPVFQLTADPDPGALVFEILE